MHIEPSIYCNSNATIFLLCYYIYVKIVQGTKNIKISTRPAYEWVIVKPRKKYYNLQRSKCPLGLDPKLLIRVIMVIGRMLV